MGLKAERFDAPLLLKWLEERKNMEESTRMNYERCLNRFFSIDPDIDDLNEYNSFLVGVAYKKSQWYYYFLFKHYLNFKNERGDIDGPTKRKILDGMIRPVYRDPKRMTARVSLKKRREVVDNLDTIKHQMIAMIQIETGVRANDIMKLKVNNISNEIVKDKPAYRLLLISKGQRRTPVYIFSPTLQKWFHEYLIKYNNSEGDYVFIEKGTMKGRRGQLNSEHKMYKMNYQWYWKALKVALDKTGITEKSFSTHDFRRNFAVDIWTDPITGKNIKILQDILHHSDPKTTMRYLRNEGLDTMDALYDFQTRRGNE